MFRYNSGTGNPWGNSVTDIAVLLALVSQGTHFTYGSASRSLSQHVHPAPNVHMFHCMQHQNTLVAGPVHPKHAPSICNIIKNTEIQ